MIKAFKYFSVFSIPLFVYFAFTHGGWITYSPLLYSFVAIPILELLVGTNPRNLSEAERETAKNELMYDWLLYLTSALLFVFVAWFFVVIREPGLSGFEKGGRVTSLGILLGVMGINVAHELGHRHHKGEQLLAQALLLTSQYMHFFIEHNKGHHKRVSTKEDPASARKGELIYTFWLRTILFSYLSAWEIQLKELRRKQRPFFSFKNTMLIYTVIQLFALVLIYALFGAKILLYYCLAALMGILLLETINYIEHYGLERKKESEFRYEVVQPWHSWNSNHIIGRIMLFELTRHSDHHYDASKKYQLLDNHEYAPTLPLGYPGSMLMTLIPPLWFFMIDKRILAIKKPG